MLSVDGLVAYLEEQGVRAVVKPAESQGYDADVEVGDVRIRVGEGFATVVRWDGQRKRPSFGTTRFDDHSLIQDVQASLRATA